MENSSNSPLQRTAAKKIQFFLQSNTHKALLVTGARQVGKTTLLRQLGQEAFPNFVELNFLENTAARQLFETATDSSDFLLRLSALVGEKLVPGKTLIFLDEVQECKEIVTAIYELMGKVPEGCEEEAAIKDKVERLFEVIEWLFFVYSKWRGC